MLTLQRRTFEGRGLCVLSDRLWVRPRNTPDFFPLPLSLPPGRNMGVASQERRQVCSHQPSAQMRSRNWVVLLGAPAGNETLLNLLG